MIQLNSHKVDILINDKPVKCYSHEGKLFIEAKLGSEYSIRVKNNSYSRKLVVVSVDGINAVNGEAAGVSNAGYVINGTTSYKVKGFRISNEEVNAFKFSTKEKSYAANSNQSNGDTSNCGVIGVRFFSEKEDISFLNIPLKRTFIPNPIYPESPWIPFYRDWTDPEPILPYTWTINMSDTTYSSCNNTPIFAKSCASKKINAVHSMNCSSVPETLRGFDVGTEFSEKSISDQVITTKFESDQLETEIQIYYASREALIEMGVPVDKKELVSLPSAFPSSFCKPPKNFN